MRKYAGLIGALVLAVAVIGTRPAQAGTVSLTLSSDSSSTTFTISGTYDPNAPTVANFSAPNEAYSMSFTLPTTESIPAANYAEGAGFLINGVDLTFDFDGVTTSFNDLQVQFYTDTNGYLGGLFLCFDPTCSGDTYWDINEAPGQQLFTGDVSDPTFGITGLTAGGTADADVDQTLSGYEINGFGPFPFGQAPSATPEPASLFLLGTGLFGLGIVMRKRLHLT